MFALSSLKKTGVLASTLAQIGPLISWLKIGFIHTTKLAGSTSLKNINICIHKNRIRGGSELKQKVGDFVT